MSGHHRESRRQTLKNHHGPNHLGRWLQPADHPGYDHGHFLRWWVDHYDRTHHGYRWNWVDHHGHDRQSRP